MSVPACGDDEMCVLSAGDDGSLLVWDHKSGAVAGSLKGGQESGCPALSHSAMVSIAARPDAWRLPVSHAILAAHRDRPFVHVWQWGKDQPHLKCASPEKLSCLAATSDGGLLFGGGGSGKAYVWDLASGCQLGAWFAHYKAVASAAVAPADALLITAGEDAVVHVWTIATVVDSLLHDPTARIAPYRTLSAHTLPVTCVRVGLGGSSSRLYSVSHDRLCNVWGLHTSDPLATLAFPAPLTVCAVDPCETRLFAGATDGAVYALDLHATALAKTCKPAAGAASTTPQCYRGHTKAVTDVRVTPSGSVLLSASEDGSVKVWDVSSCQVVRSFENHKAPVRSLLCLAKVGWWFGLGKRAGVSVLPVAHLRKAVGQVDTSTRALRVLSCCDPVSVTAPVPAVAADVVATAAGVDPAAAAEGAAAVAALEGELAAMRERMAQLEGDNARWQRVNTELLGRLRGGAAAGTQAPPAVAPDAAQPALPVESTADDDGDDAVAAKGRAGTAEKKRKRRQ